MKTSKYALTAYWMRDIRITIDDFPLIRVWEVSRQQQRSRRDNIQIERFDVVS